MMKEVVCHHIMPYHIRSCWYWSWSDDFGKQRYPCFFLCDAPQSCCCRQPDKQQDRRRLQPSRRTRQVCSAAMCFPKAPIQHLFSPSFWPVTSIFAGTQRGPFEGSFIWGTFQNGKDFAWFCCRFCQTFLLFLFSMVFVKDLVQNRLYRSTKLWSLCIDLEELGSSEDDSSWKDNKYLRTIERLVDGWNCYEFLVIWVDQFNG